MSVSPDDLLRVPLFQGMTDRALDALSALALEVEFQPGDTITAEGQPGDCFYLLLEGQAGVTTAARGPIRDLGPGDYFGEISLVEGGERTATVEAATHIRAVAIRREGFQGLLERFPAVRLGILMSLTERTRADQQPGA